MLHDFLLYVLLYKIPIVLICRVKYFLNFDTYIYNYLKSVEKCANYKPRKYTRTINMSQGLIFPPIYDVVLADYDVSPSCKFSHATAQIFIPHKIFTDYDRLLHE